MPYLKKNNSRENPFWAKDFEERVKSHIFALENLPFLRIRISLEKAMSALSVFILVLSFPIVFVVHDAEEVIVQHRWMQAHRESLCQRFPKARPMINHLSSLNTKAFAIAALEELLVLIVATCYVLVDGIYSTQVWSALFIAFSFHLFVHFGQAILFRGYVPGVVTSLIVLPYSLYGLWSIWLITSGIEFMLLAICGIIFIGINLKFAHWLGMKRLQKKKQS